MAGRKSDFTLTKLDDLYLMSFLLENPVSRRWEI